MKQKQKVSASSIVFYVISVILLLVFAFQVYYSYDYISGYDLDFAAEWKAVFSIYFGQCVLPFVGAVVTYGIGLILTKLPNFEEMVITSEKEEKADDAMEDLVSSLKEVKEEKQTNKKADKTGKAETEDSDKTVKAEKTEKKAKPATKKTPAKTVKEDKEEIVADKNVEEEMPKDKVEA